MLKVAGGGISGSLNYQGTWNANSNSPMLIPINKDGSFTVYGKTYG